MSDSTVVQRCILYRPLCVR